MEKMEYYASLADKLRVEVEKKDLSESLTLEFYRLIDMLSEDVLELEQKHRVSILAENALNNVRDFPNKASAKSRK